MSCTNGRDSQRVGIANSFERAFERMMAAGCVGELEGELSNALNQLYRLHELCKARLGSAFDSRKRSSPPLVAVQGAVWARAFDVHQAVAISELSDRYSHYTTNLYGVLTWKPLDELPAQKDKYARHLDYQKELEGSLVLESIRDGFDALQALLE